MHRWEKLNSSPPYARWFWRVIPNWLVPMPDSCANPHPYVLMNGIQIDKGISELIEYLWSIGVKTEGSCEGDREMCRVFEKKNISNLCVYANPYAALVGTPTLEDARAVKKALDPVENELFLIGTDDSGWFVSFYPELLTRRNWVR